MSSGHRSASTASAWWYRNCGFDQLFQRHCGLGPKRYASLVRFQSLLRRLEREHDPDWTQLALEHGYYDQSHMVNQFQEMTGHSPTRYMQVKGPFLNWLPVDGR